MKYRLNTNLIPFFSGTYETIWQVIEYDDDDDDGNELNIDYDHRDLMKSIVTVFKENENYILKELQQEAKFIKSIKFTNTFSSPKEYNFSTDVIDFDIEINQSKLKKVLKELEHNQDFKNFLKENYSSYDGFMSFTPNNYNEIKENIENNGMEAEQSISAIINYLVMIARNTLHDIEETIYEEWSCNGYGGLDYNISEY
jgi:hypothetical protein